MVILNCCDEIFGIIGFDMVQMSLLSRGRSWAVCHKLHKVNLLTYVKTTSTLKLPLQESNAPKEQVAEVVVWYYSLW